MNDPEQLFWLKFFVTRPVILVVMACFVVMVFRLIANQNSVFFQGIKMFLDKVEGKIPFKEPHDSHLPARFWCFCFLVLMILHSYVFYSHGHLTYFMATVFAGGFVSSAIMICIMFAVSFTDSDWEKSQTMLSILMFPVGVWFLEPALLKFAALL
jgi:hypothetical protein